MNLVLLETHEIDAGVVHLKDRRATHLRRVLRVGVGDRVRVGLREGPLGEGTVTALDDGHVSLAVAAQTPPPARAEIDVILALPRPKALKRVVSTLAQMGINRVLLLNAARVERGYFDSKVLNDAFLSEWVDQGLEQAVDTRAPKIEIRQRFKPFVEDELSEWLQSDTRALMPHPTAATALRPVAGHVTLAIGPDGGWVPFEVELLSQHGFEPASLGPRVLRVEVAVPAACATVRAPFDVSGGPS